MILYHGSSEIVEKPIYGKGYEHNDYGRGFYCTESLDLAKEWACPADRDGFANKYEFNTKGLKILRLNSNKFHILNWIAILLNNRIFAKRSPISRSAADYIQKEFLPDLSPYDVICGYRADDSYFTYAKDFLNNTISVEQLAKAMKLDNLGEQIVLISPKAFKHISFIGYEIANSNIYSELRQNREKEARKVYQQKLSSVFSIAKDAIFVRDILQQEIKNDDSRLR